MLKYVKACHGRAIYMKLGMKQRISRRRTLPAYLFGLFARGSPEKVKLESPINADSCYALLKARSNASATKESSTKGGS